MSFMNAWAHVHQLVLNSKSPDSRFTQVSSFGCDVPTGVWVPPTGSRRTIGGSLRRFVLPPPPPRAKYHRDRYTFPTEQPLATILYATTPSDLPLNGDNTDLFIQ